MVPRPICKRILGGVGRWGVEVRGEGGHASHPVCPRRGRRGWTCHSAVNCVCHLGLQWTLLGHHVNPHPHIMEPLCSQQPFQSLDIVRVRSPVLPKPHQADQALAVSLPSPARPRGEPPHSRHQSKVGSQSKPTSQCSPFAAHLLVCCKPLNKVCRDLSRHHPAPPASPAPPSPPAPPGTPGTLLHSHPDMILTSLSCSFLFLHDPLSFWHSSFNSLLDLFPSGESCSQADRGSLDDTPTVNR